jgi:asparagine synthase (glutamine-hydrolysing)
VAGRDGASPEPSGWDSRLTRALAVALGDLPGGPPRSLLFSGGVDSGLLAWELRSDPSLTLSTIGLDGSADAAAAGPAAHELGLPWTFDRVTAAEVEAVARRIESETRSLGPTARAVEVAFTLAVERAPPGVVVCGQGADELFFGYAHYRGLDLQAAAVRGEKDLENLLTDAWPRTRRIAASLGRRIEAPYLHPEFIEAAREISVDLRLDGPVPKQAFREFARRRGLPDSLALRPKKALQYGTGVDRALRRALGRSARPT